MMFSDRHSEPFGLAQDKLREVHAIEDSSLRLPQRDASLTLSMTFLVNFRTHSYRLHGKLLTPDF